MSEASWIAIVVAVLFPIILGARRRRMKDKNAQDR